MNIKWAELHNPLFLGGTNLQLKLDPAKRTGLKMEYNRNDKELLVTWNNQTAIVPISNVASMVPGEVEAKPAPAPAPAHRIVAQVDHPTLHAHKGPGYGKTGK